jgi:hypothetical protein
MLTPLGFLFTLAILERLLKWLALTLPRFSFTPELSGRC